MLIYGYIITVIVLKYYTLSITLRPAPERRNMSGYNCLRIKKNHIVRIYFTNLHSKAEFYKQLCLISDRIVLSKEDNINKPVFANYKLLNKTYDKRTNFKVAAFVKSKEIVICFVGTDSKSYKDNIANLKMGFGKVTRQMKLAVDFAKKIQSQYPKYKFVTAGHSEGGSEALFTGLSLGIPVFSYNAFCLSDKIKNIAKKNNKNKFFKSLINNYRTPEDLVSKLFYNDIGNTYIVENTILELPHTLIRKTKAAHALKNMGNCKYAVPIEIYKMEHPHFIDKIFKKNSN